MKTLLNRDRLLLTIKRLAHQLLEEESELEEIVFIGIQPRGVEVARRIVAEMESLLQGQTILFGKLDITFYRDDVRNAIHLSKKTVLPFSIEKKRVILIDDVLYTGRTIRAALDALQDFGRPLSVKLAVLVDRQFNRELPIQPDFCGLSINTQRSQTVKADWENETVVLHN